MPVITTNNAANAALNFLNNNSAGVANSVAQLASGSRIVQASDDASGLAIASQLQANATVFQQDVVNVHQGQSLLQIADGALAQISSVLSRLLSLANESASGQVTDTQRSQDINTEYQQLVQEINSISSSAQYGGQSVVGFQNSHGAFSWNSSSAMAGYYEANVMLDAQYGAQSTGQLTGETGDFTDTGQQTKFAGGIIGLPEGSSGSFVVTPALIQGGYAFGPTPFLTGIGAPGGIGVSISAINSATLGLETDTVSFQDSVQNNIYADGTLESTATYLANHPDAAVGGHVTTTVHATTSNVATQSAAMSAIDLLNKAISTVANERATVGSYESRFVFSEQVAQTDWQQTTAAASVLFDADVAGVKARLSAQDVTTQAAVAATVQANELPTELLKLIQS